MTKVTEILEDFLRAYSFMPDTPLLKKDVDLLSAKIEAYTAKATDRAYQKGYDDCLIEHGVTDLKTNESKSEKPQ